MSQVRLIFVSLNKMDLEHRVRLAIAAYREVIWELSVELTESSEYIATQLSEEIVRYQTLLE